LALIGIGIIFTATASAQSTQPQRLTSFIESAGPPDANPQYFPSGVFSADPDRSEFRARWYAKHLRAMGEESLFSAAANRDFRGYRFLWLRTFHHPVATGLQIRPDGSGQLTSIEMTGAGGYEPGVVRTTRIVELSKEQVDQFETFVRAADFWTLPTHDPGKQGFDGSQWTLEGVRDQKYHIIDRWTPKDGAFRETCLYLLKLSQIKVNSKDIY
jgi:hypothetical protein